MRILAIETSCDETAVAILECEKDEYRVLGNALFSQASLHAEYGGVYPNLAKREHQKNLPILLERALREAAGETEKSGPRAEGETGDPRTFSASSAADLIDLIAVTRGPGLEPALWTGITFAEELGKKWGVPVLGIDHMEGHIVSALLKSSDSKRYTLNAKRLPLLALLISGGHTELVLMKNWFEYEMVGRTKDDAIGEAFDKVARMLGFPYPGGPQIAKAAKGRRERGEETDITFPRPMAYDNTCDFSFSGLKTAVLYKLLEMPELTEGEKASIAQAFEDAARDVVVIKTRRALQKTRPATLAVAGGVSANEEIRAGLTTMVREEFPDTTLAFPDSSLTGDNAIMIGAAAYLRALAGLPAPGAAPLQARGYQSLA